jgi:hypothetical protein
MTFSYMHASINPHGAMDDPLHTEYNSRYALDALDTDFVKRLGFAAAPSLRYFDSGSEEDRE